MNRFFYTAAILFFFTGCFTNNEWFVRWCIEINLSVVLSDEEALPNAYILELNTGLVAFLKHSPRLLVGEKNTELFFCYSMHLGVLVLVN